MAGGSFVLIRQARLGDSVQAAERTAKVDLTLAAGAGSLAPAARHVQEPEPPREATHERREEQREEEREHGRADE